MNSYTIVLFNGLTVNDTENQRCELKYQLGVFICLFGFYGITTFVGYLMPNDFYTNKQFYFKQFSLA